MCAGGIRECGSRFIIRRRPVRWVRAMNSRAAQDGSTFPVEIGLSPLPARAGEGAQVAVSIRDVTERKAGECSLQAKAKAEEATEIEIHVL